MSSRSAGVLGLLLAAGLVGLGYVGGNAARSVKMLERVVTVKGLAEREVMADVVIWPVVYQVANADLTKLFLSIEDTNAKIQGFLLAQGITADEMSIATPNVTDLHANNYGNKDQISFRFTATGNVTVYSQNVDAVRAAMGNVVDLGKLGVVVTGNQYDKQTQFLFNGLSDIKPAMVEEATQNARSVAEKFAADSDSQLGKIRSAQQGQFSISDRDSSTPHIKKVRVVSTLEYYLSD